MIEQISLHKTIVTLQSFVINRVVLIKLKVMTFLKLSFSSLCNLINSVYKDFGVEPVARPKTHFSFSFVLQ